MAIFQRRPAVFDDRMDMTSHGRLAEAARRNLSHIRTGSLNQIQVGRYLRFLQKFLGMKAREPADITLAPELMAQVALFHGAENRYLEAWDRFGVMNQQTPAAANQSQWRLRNPSGSNVICVIEGIDIASAAAQQFVVQVSIGGAQNDLGTVVAANNLDSRGRPASTCVFSFGTLAVATSFIGVRLGSVPANTGFQLVSSENEEIAFLPGSNLTVTTSVSNQKDSLALLYRERFLEDSERA